MTTRQLLRTLCFALALLASRNALATTETYDFTTLGNKVNPSKGEQVTVGGKTMWKLTYDTETFDGKFAYGARLDNGNDDSSNYRFMNESGDKGLDIIYSNRSFAILNVKNGDKITFNVFKNTFSIVGTSYLRGLADNGTIESGSTYTVVTKSNDAVDILLKSDANHAEMQSVTIQDGSGEYYDFEAVGKYSLDNNSINPISVNSNTFNGRFSTQQANCFASSGSGWGFQINYDKWFSINNLKTGDEFMVKYKTENSQVLEFDDPAAVGKTDSDKGVVSETWYTLTKDVEQLKLKNTVNTNGCKTDYLNITIITNSDNGGSGDSGDSEEELTPPSISVSGQTITINPGSSSKEGATVTTKYTLDGKDPKTDGTELTSSIDIIGSATIKAYTYSSEKETEVVSEKKAIIKTASSYDSDGYGTFYFDQAANGSYYVPTPGTLQLGEETFGNRFEIASTRTDEKVFKFAHPSNDYKGLYSQYDKRTFSILNLKKGDKVTITISKKTDSETINLKFNKDDGLAVVSGQEYVVENDGSLDFISTGSVYIESVKIEAGEEITAPVINYAGGNKVTITPGASTNTGATVVTLFTTDGTEPSYTDANTHNGTIIEGESTTTEALASSVSKIIATTFSSTTDETGKTEFDFSYVADPVISFENNIVTISDVDGIEFYYTMGTNANDTAEPSKSEGTKYTTPISLTANAYIKVKAFSTTTNNSSTTVGNSYTYNITIVNPPIVTATSAINGSAVSNTITITAEEGTTIYYTTNGAEPTTGSTLYSEPLTQNTSATIKAIAVKNDVTSLVATLDFKAIATAPTIVRKGNHVIITAGATDGETNTATTTYQIGEGEEAAYSEPIVLTEANTTIKAITSTTSGNKIEVSQTFETVESVSTPSITISDKGIATITAGTSNLTGATVKTYYVTGEGDPTTVYDETNKPQLTDGQSIKAISVSEYDPSEYNVKSETASMTYTAPIPEAEGTKYDFTLYGDANGVLPTYGSDVTSGDQSLQMLAAGDNTFDNRFAVGLKRGDDAVFKFRNSDSYKGLYSQYDKRYLSILNLKAGDEVTVYMHAERAALTFSGTPIVSNASAGESVGNGTTYTVTSKGNLDFVTTGETYIEKIIINSEEVNAPSIVQTGDKVTITAGTVTPSYDGVKVKYTFAAEGEPDTEAASGAAIDIPANATVVSAVTVGKRSNSDKTSFTLLAKPEITAYTEGDAKNTIQIANANYYSTNYDGATALTISEGKPSGNGTWNAVTDGGIINTLTASSTVYAVKVDGNNISPVSAVYNFTYDTSVLPNASAPTVTASGNKVTITTTETTEGATTKYYLNGSDEGIDVTHNPIELNENATIKAVTTVSGKNPGETTKKFVFITAPSISQTGNKATITAGSATFEGITVTTQYRIDSEDAVTLEGTSKELTLTKDCSITVTTSVVATADVLGNSVSVTESLTYTVPAAKPTIEAGSGTNKVKITTTEEDANIYYAIDGEITIDDSHKYSVELEQATSATIKAIAVKDGKPDSEEANYKHIAITTLPTIAQTAESNDVVITIGATDATLIEGETITTTYQIDDAAAVGITENKTLTDLTADDNNKVITVTTTVTKDNTVTNSASVTLTFAYVAPVSDGKIDVTYDFTGFADKTNFTQADPLATADSDFDNRFAVSRITGDAGFWLRSYSDKTKGLYSRYADRTLTVKNLTAGDKVTINWHCDDSQNSDNDGKFVLTDGTDVVSGSPIVIAEDGDLTIKSAKGGTKDPCVTITSIIIHEAETLSAPTIAVNPENSNEVIITAGKTNNADATITTYYAITTDDTDPVPTTESTTKFTGSGAKETITLTQSIKIKAISVSSTESMDEQASEVKEFTYVAETLTAPTIKLALADNSVVITAGQSNNEEATVTTYYSLNGEAPTISETNEQKFTGESKELTLEADATIIAVSVSSTGKATNAASEAFAFTYDAPDGKTRFNTTYDFTEKDGNPINQDAEHKVTSNGTSLFLLAYDENTNFDNRFAIGPDSRTGNGGFYFRNNNATYKGLFTGYDSRNFSVLNLKKGDKVTLTLSNNAETLKFVEGDVVLSGKAYTAKADGNMDFVTLTGGVYIEKVVIAEAEAVQAPTLTLSEDGTKVTIAAGASNNPEAIVSTYYTTTGSISFNDGKAVTEGLTKLTADNSVVTVVGTTNIEVIAISNGGAESIVTKGSYVEPVVESDSKTYSFIGYGDQTGVIPAYATETTSGGQTLYLLATGDEIFDNRFAVGPKREDANVFKFREDGIYKGLYSQYDKRYFSILDLKKGEKVTLTINGNAETLQFADAAKVLEMTGGANAAKVAEGAKVKSGTTYYINEDGNLDFVTTGSIYIESAKISVAVEDEELTIAETVSKPTITDNGDNTVSITAGVSDAEKKVTTYYTTDGSVPTAESTEYKEALALTADCTVKAITISEQGTKSEVAELAFTYIEPKHQNGYGLYEFTGFAGTDAVTPDYDENGQLKIGAEDFDGRFACGPSNRIEDGSSFKFREAGDYKGLWSQYGDRTLTIKGLKASDSFVISGAQVSLKLTGTSIVANMESGDAIEDGVQYFTDNDGDVELITTGSTYIESIEILNGDGTLPELVSKPTMRQLQGVYNTVRLVPGRSSRGGASVATYYTTDGSEPTAEAQKVITTRNIKVPEGTQSVKAITISSTGQQSSVVEVAVSYMTPVDNGEPYNFVGYGSTGGTKPDWGSEVTIGERKMQTVSIGTENFNERFAAGPKRDDGSMMMFRDNGDYKGLWTAYADRYFSVLNLKKGDKVVLILNEKAANLQLVDGDAVVSGQEYTVGAKGSLDFVTTEGGVYIESVVIINDGEDEAETEPEPSTDPDPETPSDQTTTNYGFAEYGDATGVVPDWGETITSGGEQLSMLAIDEENFDNRLACGPVRTDDKVFKFRNSGDYKGLYSQYADRYLSILNLKDGDMVTISMHPKAANLAFRGTPAVSNGMSNVQLRRGMRAARAASAGDMVESGATYVISTSDSSVNLDFVTTGSTYISSISIVSSSEATGIKVLKNLEDEGELRIFDLMGRRVTTPVKGKLYIVNGRKMIYK